MNSKGEYLIKSNAFIERLKEDVDFITWVKEVRNKYNIKVSSLEDYYDNVYCIRKDCDKHSYCKIKHNADLNKEVNNFISDKLGIYSYWESIILDYVATDEFILNNLVSEIDVTDSLSKLLDKDMPSIINKHRWEEYGELAIRPIAIRFSPYSTERDLIQFIRLNYQKYIKPLQEVWENEKVKIGKSRRKDPSIEDRNNFIYENKHLSVKKITSLVNEKYKKIYDYSYISKILSKLKKIRGK